MRPPSVLERIDTLPRSKRQLPIQQRDGELDLGQGGANVRWHIARTLVIVDVSGRIFRREPRKKIRFKIGAGHGRGVLLDE